MSKKVYSTCQVLHFKNFFRIVLLSDRTCTFPPEFLDDFAAADLLFLSWLAPQTFSPLFLSSVPPCINYSRVSHIGNHFVNVRSKPVFIE